jgi:hypothetical protein
MIVHYNQGEGDKTVNVIQAAGISQNAIENTKNIPVHRLQFLCHCHLVFIGLLFLEYL